METIVPKQVEYPDLYVWQCDCGCGLYTILGPSHPRDGDPCFRAPINEEHFHATRALEQNRIRTRRHVVHSEAFMVFSNRTDAALALTKMNAALENYLDRESK